MGVQIEVVPSAALEVSAAVVEVNIGGSFAGGGGAVDSVNGQTGVVVLDAADVGAASTAHAATHTDGGTDEISIAGAQITTGTVGTARLGSGTADATVFLRGDQTWAVPAGGGGNTIPSVPWASGAIYTLGGTETIGSVQGSLTVGRLMCFPLWLPAGTYNGLGCGVSSGGTATWRLGIYSGTTAGPTSLIVDAGTISMSSPGLVWAATSFTIPQDGLYWTAVMSELQSSNPAVVGWNGNTGATPNLPWLGNRVFGNPMGRSTFMAFQSGVPTGSLPSTPALTGRSDIGPQIMCRAG